MPAKALTIGRPEHGTGTKPQCRLLGRKASETEMLNELYLATLSRLPTQEDAKVSLGAGQPASTR